MKSATLTNLKTIKILDVPEPPPPGAGEVLLDVLTVGVCGSDVHYYKTGRIGSMEVEFPFRVGHEFSARVAELGDGVETLAVGDRVTVDPLVWCMDCDQCALGRFHTCRRQSFLGCPGQREGCLCERIVMPARNCFRVPAGMDADLAAVAEPFTIGYYASRLAALLPDSTGRTGLDGATVAILGAGPIGLCTQAACRSLAPAKVYMTEILSPRVEFAAARPGVEAVFNPHRDDVVRELTQLRHPEGVDVVFECAGRQSTLDEAVSVLKPGGKLLIVGIPEEDRVSFVIDSMRRKELCVQNVRRQNEATPAALELIAAEDLGLAPMMTHRFSLKKAAEAFSLVSGYRDGVVKAMIRVNE